jgi:hypothetical protein
VTIPFSHTIGKEWTLGKEHQENQCSLYLLNDGVESSGYSFLYCQDYIPHICAKGGSKGLGKEEHIIIK